MRACRIGLALSLLGASPAGPRPLSAQPAGAAGPRRASLLLITVDTLRPDALGWISGRQDTPAIDRLAREGFGFAAAVAPVPLTLPSHVAMLASRTPASVGVRDNGRVLGTGVGTLAESLKRTGYATGAFVSGYPLAAGFGLDRGFDRYDDRLAAGREGDLERPAQATTAAALAWLRAARPPWFAWVHYYDPHYPYEAPAAFKRPGPRGAYDAEVAYTDHAIEELRREIGRLGPDAFLTVFAGDHGESLGEHGEGTHGFFVYDSTILVPLIFHFPGRIAPGRSASPARLLDLAPTALALLGQPPLPEAEGVSLTPTLAGRPQALPPAYIETRQPWSSYGWSPLEAVRNDAWKLIQAPRPELYDLKRDPMEAQNVIDRHAATARELASLLGRTKPGPASSRGTMDPEVAERLRSLGYVGSGGSDAEPPATGLRDPKDGAALRELMTAADQQLRRGDPRSAVTTFDRVLSQDPRNRFALLRSGSALLQLGELRPAIARLRSLLQLDPDHVEGHEALAAALSRAGQHGSAAEEWKEVVRLQPRRAVAWASLGAALGLATRKDDAVKALAHAVELEPKDPELLARLGFAEHGAGRIEAAAAHLERAAAVAGKDGFAYSGSLGLILQQLGRSAQARSWLERSRPGEGDFAEAKLQLAVMEADAGRRDKARSALLEALAAAPELKARAQADPRLAPLLR
jgi:arylsulfatase A-like enzyme/Flp pilus assembly protein TadD